MTSMANYDNDLTVFFTRPKSGAPMAMAFLFILWALAPELKHAFRRLAHLASPAEPLRGKSDGHKL